MIHFLADENFNADIVRGLLRHDPALNLLRVQDVGLRGAGDAEVLAWAGENDRILLTHDRATMPFFAYDRAAKMQPMAGVFIFEDRFPPGRAIDELLLILRCTEQADWRGRIVYLPL
jgi:hypothetical protein